MHHVLIPAAGYGKRVGTPHAKELFLDPNSGRPLIDFSLSLAAEIPNSKTLVITRREKTELIKYLNSHPSKPTVLLIEPSREWPDTLIQVQTSWGITNTCLLPDTRFTPITAHQEAVAALRKGAACAFATFETKQFSTWGVISKDGQHCEKPQDPPTDPDKVQAWGLFGFSKSAGPQLLSQLLESTLTHKWFTLPEPHAQIALTSFQDLTR